VSVSEESKPRVVTHDVARCRRRRELQTWPGVIRCHLEIEDGVESVGGFGAGEKIIRRPSSGVKSLSAVANDGGVIEDRGADGSSQDVRRNHYCRDSYAAEHEVEGRSDRGDLVRRRQGNGPHVLHCWLTILHTRGGPIFGLRARRGAREVRATEPRACKIHRRQAQR
jgi:hypothetical protein